MSDKEAIFSISEHLTDKEAMLYAAHKLNSTQVRRVELHMADCEMCSDVVEGLMNSTKPIDTINAELSTRIDKILPSKKINLFSTKWIAAAAMVTTVLVSGILFLKLKDHDTLTHNDKTTSLDSVVVPATSATETIDSNTSPSKEIIAGNKETISPVASAKNQTSADEISSLATDDVADVEKYELNAVEDKKSDAEEVLIQKDAAVEKPSAAKEEIALESKKPQVNNDTFADFKDVSIDSRRGNDIRTGNSVQMSETESLNEIALSKKSRGRKKSKANLPAPVTYAPFNESTYNEAINDYNNKHFAACIEKINEVYGSAGKYVNHCNYYLAASWYQQQNYTTAEFYFTKIKIEKKFEHREDALWFRALNAIQLKNNLLAQQLLNDLIGIKGKRMQEAQNLLQLVKENK